MNNPRTYKTQENNLPANQMGCDDTGTLWQNDKLNNVHFGRQKKKIQTIFNEKKVLQITYTHTNIFEQYFRDIGLALRQNKLLRVGQKGKKTVNYKEKSAGVLNKSRKTN